MFHYKLMSLQANAFIDFQVHTIYVYFSVFIHALWQKELKLSKNYNENIIIKRSISRNVAHLNILVHVMINLLYYTVLALVVSNFGKPIKWFLPILKQKLNNFPVIFYFVLWNKYSEHRKFLRCSGKYFVSVVNFPHCTNNNSIFHSSQIHLNSEK